MDRLEWYYLKQKLMRPVWWLRYRFDRKHQYHIIRTELEPGYHDCDYQILHGAFAPFKDFMDNIYDGESHVIWDYSEVEPQEYMSEEYIAVRQELWNEMETLYYWWTSRDSRQENMDANWTPELEEAADKEETEMLCRLIHIRKYLWDQAP